MKMELLLLILMAQVLTLCDGFTMQGSGPLVVPLGGSVVLPCSVDMHLPIEGLEVEWRRTDSETVVHLFQDGKSRPESQHQNYHNRAHFFTEEIQQGNFSIMLENVRIEDEGEYRCNIYSEQDSAEILIEIIDVERLIVSGSNHSISAYFGEDVTLSCSIDSHIPPEKIEEVSWKKTDRDKNILVLLLQNNEIISESAHERYRDRAELFINEIPKGNFSLRLKSVRMEDKGVFMCQVFAGDLSANTTVVLEQVGFSVLHIMVLIFCITASGSALLICFLIYCRSQYKALCLQILLVVCPNIILFFAFILWGVTEGSLYETISCCTLHILRVLMLFWAAPYLKDFPDIIRRWIDSSSIDVQLSLYTVLFYSVLFTRSWTTIVQYTEADKAIITVLFVLMLLMCLIKVIKGLTYIIMEKMSSNEQTREQINNVLRGWELLSCRILPLLQFSLLFYSFGAAKKAFFVTGVMPVIVMLSDQEWYLTCLLFCSDWLGKTIRLIIMLVANAGVFVMIYFYFKTLENEKDRFAFVCMTGIIQLLWMIRFSFDYLDFPRSKILYLFGAVVLVLVNSVGLMTELILKAVNGERTVEDLRLIVFPSECLFFLIGITVEIFTFSRSVNKRIKQKKTKTDKCINKWDSQKTTDLCEMDPLPQTVI